MAVLQQSGIIEIQWRRGEIQTPAGPFAILDSRAARIRLAQIVSLKESWQREALGVLPEPLRW